MFAPPPDKPQSVGDLVGRAFRIFRQGIPLYFQTLAGPTVVAALGGLGVQWVLVYGFSDMSEKPTDLILYLAILLLSLIILLVTRFVLTIRQLSFLRMAGGFSPDYASAHEHVRSRKWMILAIFLLAAVATAAVTIAGILGFAITAALPRVGVAAMTVTVGSILLILVSFLSAYYLIWITLPVILAVLSCEELKLNASISHGISLVKNDLGRGIAFGLLLFFCMGALSYPLCLPLIGLEVADAYGKDLLTSSAKEVYKLPLYLMVLSEIWESLMYMLLWPIAFIAYGLFYSDLRLRQEGLDISRNLESLAK